MCKTSKTTNKNWMWNKFLKSQSLKECKTNKKHLDLKDKPKTMLEVIENDNHKMQTKNKCKNKGCVKAKRRKHKMKL